MGVEGYIKPGCVHLVMDAYLSPADAHKVRNMRPLLQISFTESDEEADHTCRRRRKA